MDPRLSFALILAGLHTVLDHPQPALLRPERDAAVLRLVLVVQDEHEALSLVGTDRLLGDEDRRVLAADRDTVTEIKALLGMAAGRSYADQERAERQAQVRRFRDLAGIGE